MSAAMAAVEFHRVSEWVGLGIPIIGAAVFIFVGMFLLTLFK
jgi:hypothetical protein